MGNTLDIGKATLSDQTNVVTDYSIDPKMTDGATGSGETTYMNTKWAQQFGYFNSIADLKSALIMKSVWDVGKGYECDADTQVILEHINGWGKDTFDDILFNLELVKRIGGDSFAEIIRDDETGTLINLKTLDPSTIRIVTDKKGIIVRYEQVSKTPNLKPVTFKPNEILHLSNNRLADQIHGISDIDAVEQTLLADGESFSDMKKIMHRQAKPLIMFKIGTDKQEVIDAFIAKMDAATQKGENIYLPDDANSVSYEVVQVQVSPLVINWRDEMRKKFYRTIGLPELLPSGGGDATESGGKIGYLCFEQIVEKDQRYIEAQLWAQLNIRIDLIPPASLSQDLNIDQQKDGGMAGLNMQPSDTNAARGR